MNVLVVSAGFPLSSDEVVCSFIFDEASKLSNSDVTIHVARGVKSILNRKKDFIMNNMCVHNYDGKIGTPFISFIIKGMREYPFATFLHGGALATLFYSWFISELVKTYNIDLIHAHFAYPEGTAAMLAKKRTGKRLVLTVHGADVQVEPSIGYGIRLQQHLDDAVKVTLMGADKIIAVSTAIETEVRRIIGRENGKVVYLPNAVDVELFNPGINGSKVRRRLNINEDQPIIFSLRHLYPVYGLEYLIRAAYSVVEEFPSVVFIIGGGGELRKRLEGLTRELGLGRNVIFTGSIPRSQVPYYIAACDIFVVPSLMEGLPLSPLEAMACGKPLIGTNVGGIPDIIRDGLNGYLVSPKDPKSIADKIMFLLENPDLAKKMGVNGRKTAETYFNADERIKRIISIYRELMNS